MIHPFPPLSPPPPSPFPSPFLVPAQPPAMRVATLALSTRSIFTFMNNKQMCHHVSSQRRCTHSMPFINFVKNASMCGLCQTNKREHVTITAALAPSPSPLLLHLALCACCSSGIVPCQRGGARLLPQQLIVHLKQQQCE